MFKDSYDLAVIVPIRNTCIKLLDRCLNSIKCAIRKSGCKTQVILIDDYSDLDFFNKHSGLVESKHPKYIHKRISDWQGCGGARNRGIEISNADYLLFVDSDDILRIDAINLLITECNKNTIVFANHIKVSNKTEKEYKKNILLKLHEKIADWKDSPFLYVNLIGFPVVIPRQMFWSIGAFPEGVYSGEHIALWGKALLTNQDITIKFINKTLYEYYLHNENNSIVNHSEHIQGKSKQFKLLWATLGLNVKKHVTYVNDENLPTLYLPIFDNGIQYVPAWVNLHSNNSWTLNNEYASKSNSDSKEFEILSINLNMPFKDRKGHNKANSRAQQARIVGILPEGR